MTIYEARAKVNGREYVTSGNSRREALERMGQIHAVREAQSGQDSVYAYRDGKYHGEMAASMLPRGHNDT